MMLRLARRRQPFGPVMTARAALLEERGLIEPGQRHEDLVVLAARAPVRRRSAPGAEQVRRAA